MPPAPAAANLLPSAEDATEAQFVMGASVAVQSIPELVEVKIVPPKVPTTNIVPSAEQQTALAIPKLEALLKLGIAFDAQEIPEFVEV